MNTLKCLVKCLEKNVFFDRWWEWRSWRLSMNFKLIQFGQVNLKKRNFSCFPCYLESLWVKHIIAHNEDTSLCSMWGWIDLSFDSASILQYMVLFSQFSFAYYLCAFFWAIFFFFFIYFVWFSSRISSKPQAIKKLTKKCIVQITISQKTMCSDSQN
jgi:hypothetical protein